MSELFLGLLLIYSFGSVSEIPITVTDIVAEPKIIDIHDPDIRPTTIDVKKPIIIDKQTIDKNTVVQILGSLDYYVNHCTPYTDLGLFYRNEIIKVYEIDETLLNINPFYIEGKSAASTYDDCEDLYNKINELGGYGFFEV